MKYVKKSFNLPVHLVERLEGLVQANAGTSLTFVVVQALECWMANPSVVLKPSSSVVKDTALRKSPRKPTLPREQAETNTSGN